MASYLLFSTGKAFANDFAFKGTPFFDGEVLVVLGKTGLPLFVHHQYESDTHRSPKHQLEGTHADSDPKMHTLPFALTHTSIFHS